MKKLRCFSNNELERLVDEKRLKSGKANIDKFEIIRILHDKVALLTRKYSELETENRRQRKFRKVWTKYLQNFDQFLMAQKKLSLHFLFTDLFQHFGIHLVVFALKPFIHG